MEHNHLIALNLTVSDGLRVSLVLIQFIVTANFQLGHTLHVRIDIDISGTFNLKRKRESNRHIDIVYATWEENNRDTF